MADYIVHKAIELDALSAKGRQALEANRNWIVSPKYDGCHAVFTFENGIPGCVYSRSGELVRSMDHVARSLAELYDLPAGRVAICGEAWMLGVEFNEVSGAFRRHTPQPQLQFVPFDVVPFDYNDQGFSKAPVLLGQLDGKAYGAPYKYRLDALLKRKAGPSQVMLPRYVPLVCSLTEAMAEAEEQARYNKARVDSFFDGCVLAVADGVYQAGSGKGGEFIKVKPLLSYTVTVTATVSDIGGKTGKNTCVLCFDLDGLIQKVSTGLSQAQVDEYTSYPERIINQRIEVEAMGRTVNGYLREPRFKGIRTDA